jgi:hypothetical protein
VQKENGRAGATGQHMGPAAGKIQIALDDTVSVMRSGVAGHACHTDTSRVISHNTACENKPFATIGRKT